MTSLFTYLRIFLKDIWVQLLTQISGILSDHYSAATDLWEAGWWLIFFYKKNNNNSRHISIIPIYNKSSLIRRSYILWWHSVSCCAYHDCRFCVYITDIPLQLRCIWAEEVNLFFSHFGEPITTGPFILLWSEPCSKWSFIVLFNVYYTTKSFLLIS